MVRLEGERKLSIGIEITAEELFSDHRQKKQTGWLGCLANYYFSRVKKQKNSILLNYWHCIAFFPLPPRYLHSTWQTQVSRENAEWLYYYKIMVSLIFDNIFILLSGCNFLLKLRTWMEMTKKSPPTNISS